MTHLKQFICITTLFIVLTFQFSCVKEVDNFPEYPISLTVKDSLSGVRLSWNKIETSDFVEYVIVRSTKDSIPNLADLSTTDAVIIGRISDAKRVSFFDFNSNGLLLKTYYRVFARLSNRNLSSQNYQSNSDIVQINIAPSDIVQDDVVPERFYISSSNTGQIITYDANKEQNIASTQLLAFSFPRLAVYNSSADNPDLILWTPGSNRFFVFDGKTLKQKGEVTLNASVLSLTTTYDGYVMAYTEDFNTPIKMIRLSDRQVVSQIKNNTGSFISSGSVMYRNGTKKEVYIHSGSTCSPFLNKITYGDQGQLTNMTQIGVVTANNCVNIPILKVSKTGKYVLVNRNLYNDQLNLSSPIQLLNNSAFEFSINSTEDRLYSVRQSFNGSNTVTIDESTIPSSTVNKSYQSKLPAFRTFISNDKIYLFSTLFNNQGLNVTALQKIKL
jgi:hypothetical protein